MPDFDWRTNSFGALASDKPETEPRISVLELAGKAAKESIARQLTARTAVGIAMFIALWMFHQWYRGGEIPIIRPANNYISEVPADSEFLTPKLR